MGSFLYFAYGSNMLTARLVRRCPSARAVGAAFVAGHQVTFFKRGYRDRSGKAMLSATKPTQRQFGVLFEIGGEDLRGLDRAEGVGHGYERDDRLPVVLAGDGTRVEAVSYRATAIDESLKPFDWYLALVVQGAIEHGLPPAQIERFRRTPFVPDQNLGRMGRIEALEVLCQVGCSDLRSVLGPAARI